MKIKRYTVILLLSLFCISSTVKAAEDLNKIRKFISDICLEGYSTASPNKFSRWNKSVRLSIFDADKKMTHIVQESVEKIGLLTARGGRKINLITPNNSGADVYIFIADRAQLKTWANQHDRTYGGSGASYWSSRRNKKDYTESAALFIDAAQVKDEKHMAFLCQLGLTRIMGIKGKSKVFPESMFHPATRYTSYDELTDLDKKAIVYCLKYVRPKSSRKRIETGVKTKWVKLDINKKR